MHISRFKITPVKGKDDLKVLVNSKPTLGEYYRFICQIHTKATIFQYRWHHNGHWIGGINGEGFNLKTFERRWETSDAGEYYCEVETSMGALRSPTIVVENLADDGCPDDDGLYYNNDPALRVLSGADEGQLLRKKLCMRFYQRVKT